MKPAPGPAPPAWMAEQQYVIVRTDACEGFYSDGVERTDAYGKSTTVAETQTVAEFVERNGIQDKWANHDWFIHLSQRVMRSGVGEACAKRGPAMRTAFIQAVGRVWFDFDALRGRGKAFKSRDAARAAIGKATTALLALTRKFLHAHPVPPAHTDSTDNSRGGSSAAPAAVCDGETQPGVGGGVGGDDQPPPLEPVTGVAISTNVPPALVIPKAVVAEYTRELRAQGL